MSKEPITVIELPVEGSYNARGIIPRTTPAGEGAAPSSWVFRSAALDGLTPAGEETLRAAGVDLVIDLREPTEHGARVHELEVREAPLYGEQPPASGTLESIYLGLLRDRGREITRAVTLIAEHPGIAVVHCTAGKDRTGLVIALARLAAGDARDEVVADYVLSGRVVRPARAAIAARQLAGLGLSEHELAEAERLHLDSPAEALTHALDWIDTHGGSHAYLLAHGATPAHIDALIAKAQPPAQHAVQQATAQAHA